MNVTEYLRTRPLLFDGSMGTYFAQKSRQMAVRCELANLSQPELIREIHREYLDAGARALKTNTFGANLPAFQGDEELLRRAVSAACRLAREAMDGREAFLFGDIGPVEPAGETDPGAEYCRVADLLLEEGVTCFLLETHSRPDGLAQAAAHIRKRCPTAYVIVSFVVLPEGYTRDGLSGSALLEELACCPAVDAVGFNCACGAGHMLELVRGLRTEGVTLSAMPNAGYPTVVGNRTWYQSDPAYFGEKLAQLAAAGVSILGGCCGTTPESIRQAALQLGQALPRISVTRPEQPRPEPPTPQPNALWDKLASGKRVVAVELDPPHGTDAAPFLAGAARLSRAGADAITIADCPIARARMDSSLLACKLRRELGVEPLPHMTCRDRNLNATKALLLGLHMEGVHNVLTVTGDPVPTARRDEVKSVYNFNSRMLARFISQLNQAELTTPFRIYGALNVNAVNFQVQLDLARQKVEHGVSAFLTQPVLTARALDNLALAHEKLEARILGGIIPVVSHRNACFMNNEISGITVDEEIIRLYEGRSREEGEQLAVDISSAIAERMRDVVDGYYLMTPFQRVELMCRIMARLPGESGK